MKIKKSDINLLIMLLGVLIAVVAYFLVFTEYNEKTAALESDNAVLQEEVDGLQELADNKQMYIDETARMNTEITDILARFPAGVLPEDILMYAYTLENTQSVYFESIAMKSASLVPVSVASTSTQDAVEGAEVTEETGDTVVASAGMQDTVFLYSTPVTYGFVATYSSIKDIMEGMVMGQDRMNLQDITLSFDSPTGCIKGSIATNIYTVEGSGKYYELLDIPGIQLGVDDLFRSKAILEINTGNNDYEGEKVDIADGAVEEESDEDESEDGEEKEVSEEN